MNQRTPQRFRLTKRRTAQGVEAGAFAPHTALLAGAHQRWPHWMAWSSREAVRFDSGRGQ